MSLKLLKIDEIDFKWVYLASKFSGGNGHPVKSDFFLMSDFPLPSGLDWKEATRYSELDGNTAYDWMRKDMKDHDMEVRIMKLPKAKPRFIAPGYHVDSRLKRIFSATAFYLKPRAAFQKYSPHTLCFTNPDTGKTSMAQALGICPDKAKIGAMLGFGTAKDVRIGKFKGAYGTPFFLDELQEEKHEESLGALLGMLENGKVNVQSGLSDEEYNVVSPIFFQGNPKPGEAEAQARDLYGKVHGLLRKITFNTEAFSRRVGCEFITELAVTASGSSDETATQELDRMMALQAWKIENGKQLEKALEDKEIIRWLHKPHDDWYLSHLDDCLAKTEDSVVSGMLRGAKRSFKHTRGMALRLEIIGDGARDEMYGELLKINADSFKEICKLSVDYGSEVRKQHRLASCTSYFGYFLYCVNKANVAGKVQPKKFFGWDKLEFPGVSEYFGMSQDEFKLAVISRGQSSFDEDMEIGQEGITILKGDVVGLYLEPRFDGCKWRQGVKERSV